MNPANRIMAACVLAGITAALVAAQTPDAAEVIRSSRNRISAETVSTRSRMVITARNGSTTERMVDQYTKSSDGTDRTVVIFQKPASVAGTRFLTVGNGSATDDRWIFLPALGKVRRIAASEGSGSFMGTDLSYDDLSSANRSADLDDHVLVRDESRDGTDCWVVESKPKDPGYQYSLMRSWIGKVTRMTLRVELYNRTGELSKVLEVLKAEDRQGRLTPTATRMSTVRTKTATTVYVDIVRYDDPIPDGVFTARFLETGRP